MDALRLQDTISRALGRAATVAGTWFDAYRPAGVTDRAEIERRIAAMMAAAESGAGSLP